MKSNRIRDVDDPIAKPPVPTPDQERATASLAHLEQTIGYRFRDEALLRLALTHSSLAYEERGEHQPRTDNEQLEFLGDAVLGMAVTEYLFRAYPDLNEGSLTRLRAQLVNRQRLGRAARNLALGEYLRLGKGEERNGGRKKIALLSNAIEALIAAVYLDGGAEPVVRLVRLWLVDDALEEMAAAAQAGENVGDYKSAVQEYFQAHGLGQPHYQVTSETGPDHRKSFVVALKMKDEEGSEKVLASASGARKKVAEQEAARIALEQFHADAASAESSP